MKELGGKTGVLVGLDLPSVGLRYANKSIRITANTKTCKTSIAIIYNKVKFKMNYLK